MLDGRKGRKESVRVPYMSQGLSQSGSRICVCGCVCAGWSTPSISTLMSLHTEISAAHETPCGIFLSSTAAVSNHNYDCSLMPDAHIATTDTSSHWHCHTSGWVITLALLCTRIGHPSQCLLCPSGKKSFVSTCNIFCSILVTKHIAQFREVLVELVLCISLLQLFSIIYQAIKGWAKFDDQASWINQNYQSLLFIWEKLRVFTWQGLNLTCKRPR